MRRSQSGNVFFTLFGAVALVGAVGAASMQVMKGPVRAMSEVTKRTVAENNMIASTKLAIIGAAGQQAPPGAFDADCDSDGYVEPIDPADPGADTNIPTSGGFLPNDIGAAQNDPWGTRYGYCGWDHGTNTGKCGAQKTRLRVGGEVEDQYAIVVVSAGPNKIFETGCHDYVDTTPADGEPDTLLLTKGAGSDDIVMGYTYAEANNIGGGLWTLKDGDDTKATLAKDIEVLGGAGGTETVFGLNRTTGDAEFLAIKTDNIFAKSANSTIEFGDIFRVKGYEDLDAPQSGGGGGGGSPDNLGNHTATQNLALYKAAGGVGVSGSEVDPQVGTLTNTKWCTTNGTLINCTTDAPVLVEADPKVGAVTNNKWCRGNGSAVVCDQDAPGGGGASGDIQTFDSSGTWNKPGSGTVAMVECIGGGGGGGRWSTGGEGGGGGGYNMAWIPMSSLGATVAVTIGAGGAGAVVSGNGSVGGNTTFGAHLTAYGGGGGGASGAGGGGGGFMGAGTQGTPGTPLLRTGSYTWSSGYSNGQADSFQGSGGGSSGFNGESGSKEGNGGVWHGGGGGSLVATPGTARGGGSVHGGGGGGAYTGAGGVSGAGGNGGAGGGGNGVVGGNGTQPGGGGGGARNANGGNGAAGRCRVTVF